MTYTHRQGIEAVMFLEALASVKLAESRAMARWLMLNEHQQQRVIEAYEEMKDDNKEAA